MALAVVAAALAWGIQPAGNGGGPPAAYAQAETSTGWRALGVSGYLYLDGPDGNVRGYSDSRYQGGLRQECLIFNPPYNLRMNNLVMPLTGVCIWSDAGLKIKFLFPTSANTAEINRALFNPALHTIGLCRLGTDDNGACRSNYIRQTGGQTVDEYDNFAFHHSGVAGTDNKSFTYAAQSREAVNATLTQLRESGVLWELRLETNPAADTGAPALTSVNAARQGDFEAASLTWSTIDPVTEYEIQRSEASLVRSGSAAQLEYGNVTTTPLAGITEGISSYRDAGVLPDLSYRYRMRARGSDWSAWSPYTYTPGKTTHRAAAPARLQAERDAQNRVSLTWRASEDTVDGYSVQRQELVSVGQNNIFGNAVNFGDPWLPASALSYTDRTTVAGVTYEYRVAGVIDDVVGGYTEWTRTAPRSAVVGDPPENLRIAVNSTRDEYRDVTLAWDPVPGAVGYEVRVVAGGRERLERTDAASFFISISQRTKIQVRARSQGSGCGGGGASCLSRWSGEQDLSFVPVMAEVAAPTVAAPEAEVMAIRQDLERAIAYALTRTSTHPDGQAAFAGTNIDPGNILDFIVLAAGFVVSAVCYAVSHRARAVPLGTGLGAGFSILWLWLGIRLLGTPIEWGIAGIVLVLVGGGVSVAVAVRGAR